MNTDLALALIESRMRDMGHKQEDYYMKFKHCVLQSGEIREIEAYNEFYFWSMTLMTSTFALTLVSMI